MLPEESSISVSGTQDGVPFEGHLLVMFMSICLHFCLVIF
jgi:hypothetical protein